MSEPTMNCIPDPNYAKGDCRIWVSAYRGIVWGGFAWCPFPGVVFYGAGISLGVPETVLKQPGSISHKVPSLTIASEVTLGFAGTSRSRVGNLASQFEKHNFTCKPPPPAEGQKHNLRAEGQLSIPTGNSCFSPVAWDRQLRQSEAPNQCAHLAVATGTLSLYGTPPPPPLHCIWFTTLMCNEPILRKQLAQLFSLEAKAHQTWCYQWCMQMLSSFKACKPLCTWPSRMPHFRRAGEPWHPQMAAAVLWHPPNQ